MSMIRSKWAAVGAAVAITLGAGGFSLTQAAISSGEKPVYVSLDAPCRVIDTRSGSPIGAGDAAALTVQITGANGACTGGLAIPADAVGVATNVTVIQPNGAPGGRSYFTVYPADATRPVTSNLNFVNGQAPTPNKVDVGLSADGKIKIFNFEGTAHAAVDIFGYYIDHNHDDRYYTESEVNAALGAKANAGDIYTKAEVDGALAGVAGVDYSRTAEFAPVDDSVNVLESIVIDAPEPGIVVVTASAWATQPSAGVSLRCGLSTSSSVFQGDQSANQYVSSEAQFTISMTRGFEVGAGQTIIYFLCRRDNAGTDYSIGDRNMTAVYSVNRP